jgi:lactate dehydrogenase-like 2-hydroxyacid dehydrogenase
VPPTSSSSERPIVLALLPLYQPALDALAARYELLKPWDAPDPAAFIRAAGPRVRAVVTTTSRGFARAEFESFPKLEALACFGPYLTIVDTARAAELGVAVSCTPDDTAGPVADLARARMLAALRRVCEADRFVRESCWPRAAFPAGREVSGKRVGIVGMGRIGAAVARRAEAFGMPIAWHGPRPKPGLSWRYVDSLRELARASDILVITCALTAQTRGIVDAAVLDALGPQGLLVNVARGPIVQEAALIDALREGRIGGAALDVFDDEPNVPPALMAFPNVVLAPHIGTSTEENRQERTRKLLANLEAQFAGAAVPYPAPVPD